MRVTDLFITKCSFLSRYLSRLAGWHKWNHSSQLQVSQVSEPVHAKFFLSRYFLITVRGGKNGTAFWHYAVEDGTRASLTVCLVGGGGGGGITLKVDSYSDTSGEEDTNVQIQGLFTEEKVHQNKKVGRLTVIKHNS